MTRRRRWSALAAAVGWLSVAAPALLLAGAAPSAAATEPDPDTAGLGIALIDVPTTATDDPRARVYIVDHVRPGTTIERRIRITNSTADPQSVSVYAGGASIVDDQFVPGDDNELSSWVDVSPGSVELPTGSDTTALVTIDVPARASKGERYAAVWAEIASSGTDGVRQVNRVGIRIYLDVGPGGDPRTDFQIGTIGSSGGGADPTVVTADVTNTGERAVDLDGELSLSRSDGSVRAGPFKVDDIVTLTPGATGAVQVTLPPDLSGEWTAELTLRSGTVSQSVKGTIVLGHGESELTPSGLSWIPFAVGGGILLVILAAAASWWVARRRRSRS